MWGPRADFVNDTTQPPLDREVDRQLVRIFWTMFGVGAVLWVGWKIWSSL